GELSGRGRVGGRREEEGGQGRLGGKEADFGSEASGRRYRHREAEVVYRKLLPGLAKLLPSVQQAPAKFRLVPGVSSSIPALARQQQHRVTVDFYSQSTSPGGFVGYAFFFLEDMGHSSGFSSACSRKASRSRALAFRV
ncbi:unnamed protein product, partial [Ectocarpus sp. 12 AP-2014]